MVEIWKDIEGFEGKYQVSNLGRLRNYKGRILKQSFNRKKNGYLKISLSKNGNEYTKYIHRMVAEAFVQNPYNLPEVDHIIPVSEGGTNEASNLRWCTHPENMKNPRTMNRMNCSEKPKEKKPKLIRKIIQYTKKGEFIRTWDSMRCIERELKIHHSEISETCSGKRKTAGGYIWRCIKEVA